MKPGKYVVFSLEGERFGLPVESVQQILNASPVTRIPRTAPEVIGLLDLRGETIPVINTRTLLGISEGAHHNFIVILVDGLKVAMTVDGVHRIEEFEELEIEEAASWRTDAETTFVGKKAGSLTILLNPETLLPHGVLAADAELDAAA